MKSTLKFIILLILITVESDALPQGINQLISKSTISKNDISIYIKDAGKGGSTVASLNATKLRTPASVIKVFSTYAALLKLGFDYKFPTKFYTKGSISNGVLEGDLIVKGLGDPSIHSSDLASLVAEVKKQGIRKITGHMIIDRSYFRVGSKDSSGFDKNLYSPYNAMPDAMMFNERISTICVQPKQSAVKKKNADGSYKIINHMKFVNKPCKGGYSWPRFRIDKSHAQPEVKIEGKMSRRCGKRNICKVVTKPYLSFFYAFKEALNKGGVSFAGSMRLRTLPNESKLLFTHYSKSLEKIVSKTAKKSNNLYARHLLLTLGAKMYGAPATLNKGRRAVENILRGAGALGTQKVSIDNGCGLSRTAKLSASTLAQMYDHAYDKYGQRWMKTLSIAGVDGTINKRFRGSVVKNRAWMKTGTLNRVKNIGGYVKGKSGKLYSVVILVNTNKGRWKAAQLQNDIIAWLVRHK